MGRPSSSRGSAMKSGKDSRPPASLRTSSNHREHRRFPPTKAAFAPSTKKSVTSDSPSLPQTTRRSAPCRRRMRSATGPSTAFSGRKHLSSCEKCPLLTCANSASASATAMPLATAARNRFYSLTIDLTNTGAGAGEDASLKPPTTEPNAFKTFVDLARRHVPLPRQWAHAI